MEISVLGPLTARLGQTSVVPSAAKPRQVLALLALNSGREVSVSALADELWGDGPPRSAAATLHTYVKQLRRMIQAALGPAPDRGPREVLGRRHTGYVLDAPRTARTRPASNSSPGGAGQHWRPGTPPKPPNSWSGPCCCGADRRSPM